MTDAMVTSSYRLATSTLKGRLIAPYQREGVLWLLWRELVESGPKGGFLCDEMGLGKTVQTIAMILGNPNKTTLIIVPKSIVTQWSEEIENFAPNLKVGIHDGPNRTRDYNDFLKYDVVITPYSVLVEKGKPKGEPTVLHGIHWGRIIIDEGHEIRNPRSKLSASVINLRSHIRWVLSGTPVYNSIRDFVTLCAFVGISKSMVQGMSQKIRDTYVMRRTKEDVAKFNIRLELPPCDFKNVELVMYPEERKLYSDVFEKCSNTVKEIFAHSINANMHMMHILECLLRCRQAMIHPQLYLTGVSKQLGDDPELWEGRSKKMETLMDMIRSHPTEKSLIFSQFVGEMDIIHDLTAQDGIKVFRIDGSVAKDARTEQIKAFKSCDVHCVFIIQIKAGGQGLNLQEATRVYITSPSWNPATELQAIGRSHRTGQTGKVTVRKLVYMGEDRLPSIEQTIMSLQEHKAIVCSEVLNDPRLAKQIPPAESGALTLHNLRNIFAV
jgi:SNF2 family DNA or RNA helicase